MNWIPEREPSFPSEPGTYACNRFALRPIILNEDFQMETAVEQIKIKESDHMANPHSHFHFYLHLLNIIDFQNQFLFPAPVYTYLLPTTALVHTLTTDELLDHPTSAVDVEPTDEELLDRLIFDLNIAKLPLSTDVLALPTLAATADLTAMTMQINDFLKLTLDDISTFAPVPMDESIPVQPTAMDAKTNTTRDQTRTHILEENTMDQSTAMDVTRQEPAAVAVPPTPVVDPRIYLATPAILSRPPIIATILPPDTQWQALTTALTAYDFPSLPSGMLFPEHHWMDYPDTLKEEIQHILLPQPTPAVPVPQVAQPALTSVTSQQRLQCRPNKCRLPATQITIVLVTSLIPMMTATKKKLNNHHEKTLQAVRAVNKNAVRMHPHTTLKGSKCVRCTPPVSRNKRTSMVSATQNQD
uniref:Uncharacterized protein n=1 Tax=Romanomermis culicivorax TaxID=13658 RepID=A0A915IJQ9_ROMCU